jgi:hypothetical protein
MSQLTNPLKALISQASKQLPAVTGETAKAQHRFGDGSGAVVVLCDCSGSMAESAGGRRKIDHATEALASVLPNVPGAVVVAFSSDAEESLLGSVTTLPEPSGGTAMHRGISAAGAHNPRLTVIISDGLPDSEEAALAAAEKLPGRIDVIYCGPDSDATALAFMRRLARIGCGTVVPVNLATPRALTSAVQRLALPSPRRTP